MMKIPAPSDLASLALILEALPEGRREQALTDVLQARLDRLGDTLWEVLREAMVHTRGVVPAAEYEAQHMPLYRLTDRDRWLDAVREGYVDELIAQGIRLVPDSPNTAKLRLARLTLMHRQIVYAAREERELAQDLIDSKLPRIVPAVAVSLNISHTQVWRRYQRGRSQQHGTP